ncbi:serine hydrolase [Cytophagaceae bacterium ABcell3]|nr:serine hydrolase [Cytophagaceae bacterium ABcell3]
MSKFFGKWKKALLIFLLFILLVNIGIILLDKRFVYRALWYNFVGIDDYRIFHNREISASPDPQPWPLASEYNQYELSPNLRQGLERLRTVAFLVVKEDSIRYEEYWDDYGPSSLSNSFSMAKTFVGMLVGIALHEGKIKSLDQPIGDFLENYKGGEKDKITIRHLLTMSSGLEWDEAYASPFSTTTEAYYGTDLQRTVGQLEVEEEPGVYFNYKSSDTQLLAFVLQNAVGMPISQYLEEKIWHPIGAEHAAKWSLDGEGGVEKAYCCINSNARDFARIGKLYLNYGRWNNERLVDSAYVAQSISPADLYDPHNHGEPINFYGYKWWLIPDYKKLGNVFYARGILGQYIINVPSKDLIIVRLGHKRGMPAGKHFEEVFLMLDEVANMF